MRKEGFKQLQESPNDESALAGVSHTRNAFVSQESDEAEKSDYNSLRGLVEEMQKDLAAVKSSKPRSGATIRKRVKDHYANLREYDIDDKVMGIVLKVSNVKERKDPNENKRFIGICTLNVFDPKTGKSTVFNEVDYLNFLNEANKVQCKILRWRKDERYETEVHKGGGGVGPLYRVEGDNSVLIDPEHVFEVKYVDNSYSIEVLSGEYVGVELEVDENALNI